MEITAHKCEIKTCCNLLGTILTTLPLPIQLLHIGEPLQSSHLRTGDVSSTTGSAIYRGAQERLSHAA